jgi:hypothetical protein
MKRLILMAMSLALIASTMAVTPALAWWVKSGDCKSKPVARIVEPAGDPFGRIVVRHNRSCKGWVKVPDADWLDGGTFFIADKALTAGQRASLPPGEYVGTWSNIDEIEHVVIRDVAGPVHVAWRGIGRDGHFVTSYDIPNGCVLRTAWHYLVPESLTWVQDRTHTRRLATKAVAKAGYYGALYKGYDKGVTCPAG